jgi:hypothetical protein
MNIPISDTNGSSFDEVIAEHERLSINQYFRFMTVEEINKEYSLTAKTQAEGRQQLAAKIYSGEIKA